MRNNIAITATSASIFVVLAFIIITSLHQNADMLTTTIVAAENVISLPQLKDALSHDQLVIHLDVNWSMDAIKSRPVIAKFKEIIERDSAQRGIVFRRIDCTEQDPVWHALRKWLHKQECGDLVMHTGYGAVLWVRSGKVIGVKYNASYEGVDRLVSYTHKLMAVE